MQNLVKVVGAVVLSVTYLFFTILVTTLFSALAGWVVGMFFGNTILGILAACGLKGFVMWQIGATLGFVGSFFRTSVTTKN